MLRFRVVLRLRYQSAIWNGKLCCDTEVVLPTFFVSYGVTRASDSTTSSGKGGHPLNATLGVVLKQMMVHFATVERAHRSGSG